MIVTIIGLGLIGGSLAISLNEARFCKHIIGVDTNIDHCKEAIELNLVNEIKELNDAILEADKLL